MAAHAILLLALASTIVVEGDPSCLDEDAFARDLQAVVPSEVDLQAVTVEVLLAAEDDRVRATLLVEGRDLAPLARTFDVERAACPSLGRLVARVVARHVAPIAAPSPPPVVDDDHEEPHAAPAVVDTPAPPTEPAVVDAPAADEEAQDDARPFVLRPHAGVAVGAGVWPLLGDLRLELGASLGLEGWPALVAFARGSVVQPIALGGGQAQLSEAVVGLGATWAIELGWLSLAPRGLALAGPALAWGTGFTNGAFVVLPHVGVLGSVTVATPFGLFLDVGSELVITPARLATEGGAAVQMSFVTVYAQVGFAFDVPFGGGARARPASEPSDLVKAGEGGGHEDGEEP